MATVKRSEETAGGHGHQACYSGTGNLITGSGGLANLASAGTADFGHPSNVFAPRHVQADVRPFIRAAQLDGNPVEGGVTFQNLSHPLIRIGPHLQQYYARRPVHTANTVVHDACCDPVECATH